ncbi:MAG TPA: putative metallopeptidase [Myxococcales bacterium]|nr:putative metallopeptidase [Myxococcales bacterium]
MPRATMKGEVGATAPEVVISQVRARRAERPNATLLCRRVVADMVRTLPELSHIRASRILFVAGEARRGSRATIRPLGGKGRARVSVKGRRALYCITLRPKFFRASTPEQRVSTLLHELLHISPRFDGTLDPARRHSRMGGGKFEALLRPLLRRYMAGGDASLLGGLAHHGEVLARQWLERPTARSSPGQTYTEKALFLGPVTMLTRRRLHS